jgi:hypothetical protein
MRTCVSIRLYLEISCPIVLLFIHVYTCINVPLEQTNWDHQQSRRQRSLVGLVLSVNIKEKSTAKSTFQQQVARVWCLDSSIYSHHHCGFSTNPFVPVMLYCCETDRYGVLM